MEACPSTCASTPSAASPVQEGDLEGLLKGRGGSLLSEDDVMLRFVQLCLALQHVHSKVAPQAAAPRDRGLACQKPCISHATLQRR